MKVKNKDQQLIIKGIARETGFKETDVTDILIELGMMFSISLIIPNKDNKDLFKAILNMVENSPEMKICKAVYNGWKRGEKL